MKWINEPIPRTGYSELMFAIRPYDAEIIAKALKKPLREYQKKLEALQDMHDSGEATERQENRRYELEEAVGTINYFIKEINKQDNGTSL